jgi:hydroxyacylglutathione hydrolase
LAVAVGIRRLAGFLGGGMTSWRQEKRDVARIERLPLAELAGRNGLQILDVRERSEWDEGHIPGSTFMPWHDIDGLPPGLDPSRPIAVVCGSGQRAAVAASLVQRFGGTAIHVVEGGVPAWGRLGNELER